MCWTDLHLMDYLELYSCIWILCIALNSWGGWRTTCGGYDDKQDKPLNYSLCFLKLSAFKQWYIQCWTQMSTVKINIPLNTRTATILPILSQNICSIKPLTKISLVVLKFADAKNLYVIMFSCLSRIEHIGGIVQLQSFLFFNNSLDAGWRVMLNKSFQNPPGVWLG